MSTNILDKLLAGQKVYPADSDKLNTELYTSLTQIGLTVGSETIESICSSMPVNSMLYIDVGSDNATIYPASYGVCIAHKLTTSKWCALFIPKETSDLYVCSAKIENSGIFTFYDWEKKIGETDFNSHVSDTNNPHSVTASQVGAISKTLSTFDDANAVKTTGFYKAGSSAKNIPSDTNQGLLLVLDIRGVGGMGDIYQVFIAPYSIYIRTWSWSVQGNDWSAWRKTFNDYNIVPVTAGGTGANTEAKARKNLKTDMVLIDGYESLGLSDSDFGTTYADFVNNIVKIVNGVDSNENFLVAISDSTKSTSNLAECIQNKIRVDDSVTYINAYYSMYIYGRNDTGYPITVDVAVDNGGTPYMYRCVIGSTRGSDATRKASNFIPLIYGTSSNIWCSRNKPFFTYKGDGSTRERTIECGDNNHGYLKSYTLLITSSTHIGFATGNGGLFFNMSDGTITTFTRNEVEFNEELGYLTVETDNAAVNKLNVSYKCQAL